MPTANGQNDRFIKNPNAYAANDAVGRPASRSRLGRVTRRGSSPASMPIHADATIWNGSHGPTPAVSSADANSDVQPSTKPKPGPEHPAGEDQQEEHRLDPGDAGTRAVAVPH